MFIPTLKVPSPYFLFLNCLKLRASLFTAYIKLWPECVYVCGVGGWRVKGEGVLECSETNVFSNLQYEIIGRTGLVIIID